MSDIARTNRVKSTTSVSRKSKFVASDKVFISSELKNHGVNPKNNQIKLEPLSSVAASGSFPQQLMTDASRYPQEECPISGLVS